MSQGVLILYNGPAQASREGARFHESERGVEAEASAVAEALRLRGIPFRAEPAQGVRDLHRILSGAAEPIVFNLVEALDGLDENACLVPSFCRAYGKGVTGSPSSCLSLTLDKSASKSVFHAAGIRTPWWTPISAGESLPEIPLELYPLIVKPARADAGEGIDSDSVVLEPGARLCQVVSGLLQSGIELVLIEQYIDGREINVSLFEESGGVRMLPPAEITFQGFPPEKPRIVDYAAKWLEGSFEYENTERVVPARLSQTELTELRDLALRSWRTCGCRDYARVDLRMGPDGRFHVLEVNANPDIAPDAGFAAALGAGDVSYPEFIATVVENSRLRIPAQLRRVRETSASDSGETGQPEGIFPTRAEEIALIAELVSETGFFRPDEVAIASEVLESAVFRSEYESYTYRSGGEAVGWVCFGATPCTIGTYDVYWLAVSPRLQGRGIGKELMQFAESKIRQAGGRIAVVETAGRPDYEPTRRFYERIGYTLEHRILEFYAPGDDKIIYCKRF